MGIEMGMGMRMRMDEDGDEVDRGVYAKREAQPLLHTLVQ
jgi:hypothetical protein